MNIVRIIPCLEDEESLASYLHRVSVINNYNSISIIASEINTSNSKINNNTFTSSQLTIISNLTGICTDKVQLHSGYHFERSIGKKLINKLVIKNRVKYCPICIAEQRIHKLSWNVLHLNICTNHNVFLIEKCVQCDSLISLPGFMVGICDKCGFICSHANLRNSVFQDSIIKPQKYLYHQLFNEGETRSPFNLTFHDFIVLANFSYYLLEGLQSYLGDRLIISCFHNKKKGIRNSFNQSHAFNNLYWMYQEFPHNFYRVLNDFIKMKKPSIMYEQKGQYERISEIDSLCEVSDAYQKFWLDKINLGLIRRDF